MKNIEKYSKYFLIFIDIILINISYILATYLRYSYSDFKDFISQYGKYALIVTGIYITCFYTLKLYESLWSYASIDEYMSLIFASFLGNCLINLLSILMKIRVSYSISLLSGVFIIISTIGFRISYRIYRKFSLTLDSNMNNKLKKRTLIIGAGEAGNLVIKEIRNNINSEYKAIGVIDDNEAKIGRNILGVKILGNRNDLLKIVEDKNIEVIIIALPSSDEANKKEIIDICKKTNCNIKIVPSFYEFIDENIPLKSIKNVDIEDLLGRKQIKLNNEEISDYINNKTVLVTGGGGSIGSELCRQIAKFGPRKIIIFDIYENNAYDIQNELKYSYPSLDLEVLIGSVRDRARVEDVFSKYKPNLVFHAAAHKHVPLMEKSPLEAIKNNVFGTYNVAEFASKYKVERFVLISTDKAVNPTNIMGATKRLCEMIIQSMENISKTKFVAVRFGNVLGSNGSVIPLFKKQIENGGPITLTHKEITRFFMTIPEAAQLVLQAGAFAEGGEIFILDMGKPVKIYDLACDLIRLSGLKLGEDIEIKVTGLRPGEKLYEELLMSEEGIKETKHKSIFIGKPIFGNLDGLRKNLKELEEIIKENNSIKLNLKMKEIVKTYKTEAISEVATDQI